MTAAIRDTRIAPPAAAPPFAIAVTSVTERTRLTALIEALAGQSGLGGRRIPVFAAVGDRLAAAAASFGMLRDSSALELHLFERRTDVPADDCRNAIDAATYHLERHSPGGEGVLLICDAAALPAPDWIAANLRTLASGADLSLAAHVLAPRPDGRLRRETAASVIGLLARYHRLAVRLEDAIDPVPWDPAPRHGYESGASLGLTLATLRLAGGTPHVPVGLTRHLIARVRQSGGAVRHCPRTRIFVPPHLLCGFDATGLASPDLPMLVTDPEHLEAVFRHRAALRVQLGANFAGLEQPERDRAVRASLALTTPAEIASAAGMPVDQACARLAARLEQIERRPWQALGAEPIRRTYRDDLEHQPGAI